MQRVKCLEPNGQLHPGKPDDARVLHDLREALGTFQQTYTASDASGFVTASVEPAAVEFRKPTWSLSSPIALDAVSMYAARPVPDF